MVFALLLEILSTWFVTGHALKPVKTLAATIDTIDAHNLSTRLPMVQTKDEIQQHTQITIWNDGITIASEQLPYIFEPFYRCDSSRSNKVSGSGLGLALIQTIIQQHNGTITAYSSPQEGTRSAISIPC